MRLIDADALIMHLVNISVSYIPNDYDTYYERDYKFTVLAGINIAGAAIKEAPTVYASDWMNEMMIEDERIKKEQNDDADTEDSEIPE